MGTSVGLNARQTAHDPWISLGSQDMVRAANEFDQWRRVLEFDSIDELIESYRASAKLQGVKNEWDLLYSDYQLWRDNK